MDSTGIVRRIDELGRIVLPKELRMNFRIKERDPLEIYVDEGGKIILKKYEPTCIFCNGTDGLTTFSGRHICRKCVGNMAEHCSTNA